MPRGPRTEDPQDLYHVSSHGNYRMAIFTDRWAAFLTIYNQLGL
jgi:hypothetical protein